MSANSRTSLGNRPYRSQNCSVARCILEVSELSLALPLGCLPDKEIKLAGPYVLLDLAIPFFPATVLPGVRNEYQSSAEPIARKV